MGGWNEEMVVFLEEKTLSAISQAMEKMDTVSVSYRRVNAAPFVANRLVAGDPIDPYIRQLQFENTVNEIANVLQ
jgi:hypothetical protein